jgi:catechol 2,3-dioxygenase-like lactoylglutathione lyase family enzyme
MITGSDLFKTPPICAPNVGGMAPTFNGIGLATADMDTSLAFYRRLGLDVPADVGDEPHVEATLPGGSRLMWDTHASLRGFDPDFTPSPGGASLAFLCADAAEVDRVHDDLVGAGGHSEKTPWDAPWGQRYAVVNDPDGYQVDLFAWVKQPD